MVVMDETFLNQYSDFELALDWVKNLIEVYPDKNAQEFLEFLDELNKLSVSY